MIRTVLIVLAVMLVSLFLTLQFGTPICRLLGISSMEGGHGYFVCYCLVPVMIPLSMGLGIVVAKSIDSR